MVITMKDTITLIQVCYLFLGYGSFRCRVFVEQKHLMPWIARVSSWSLFLSEMPS
jgi:hypothetical protein